MPLFTLSQNNNLYDPAGNPVSNLNFQVLNPPNSSYANNMNGSSIGSLPLIIVDSISSPAGSGLNGLAYDGEFLWACGWFWNTIYKISTSTGTVVSSIPTTVDYAAGLTFDGNDLWITNRLNNQIHQIDKNTGNILQSFATPSTSGNGLAWNGNLWHSDDNMNGGSINSQTFCFSGSTLATLQSHYNPGSAAGLAWDGQYLWSSHNNTIGIIQKYDISTFTVVDSIITPWLYPNDLAFDGSYLWVADNGNDMIYKIDVGIFTTSGCTDSLACNYDALASIDDSSCVYNSASFDTLSVTGSIVWNGMFLDLSGDYSVTLNNLAGCDSIVNLNLTVTTTGIFDISNNKSILVKITDMLGKEIPHKRNTPLFYIYDNGTVEKKIVLE